MADQDLEPLKRLAVGVEDVAVTLFEELFEFTASFADR